MEAPSNVVVDGLSAAFALVEYVGRLSREGMGTGFFAHFEAILIAAVSAVGIILAFLILAVEIAVTIIEFHLVTLIGFVLVPFGILTQTTFLSERAIGYVVSVGVKLMALALIVSIGESIFTSYIVSPDPSLEECCGLLLAALIMVMLALKIPSIASALISGGPQLSSGSAVGGAAAIAAGVGGLALAGRMAGLAGMGAAAKAGAAQQASNIPPAAGGSGQAGRSAAGGSHGAANFRQAPVASLVRQARASFSRGAAPTSSAEARQPPAPRAAPDTET
jgi:type IV secretion system protein TrbL